MKPIRLPPTNQGDARHTFPRGFLANKRLPPQQRLPRGFELEGKSDTPRAKGRSSLRLKGEGQTLKVPAKPSVRGVQRFRYGRSEGTDPPNAFARSDSRRPSGPPDRAPKLLDRMRHKQRVARPRSPTYRATRSPRPLRGGSTTARSGYIKDMRDDFALPDPPRFRASGPSTVQLWPALPLHSRDRL